MQDIDSNLCTTDLRSLPDSIQGHNRNIASVCRSVFDTLGLEHDFLANLHFIISLNLFDRSL